MDYRLARSRAVEVLRKVGVSMEAAADTARVLIDADRRGCESHGLVLLPLYLDRILKGGINAAAVPSVRRQAEAVFSIDARDGIGAHPARLAADLAATEAKRSGVCAVSIRNNNHIGMLAAYRDEFQAAGAVGLILNISSPLVAPPGGRRATIGSNALCLIVPRPSGESFCVDMDTGIVSAGKLREAARQGHQVLSTLILNDLGQPTTDPGVIDRDGAIPVFGGYKGLAIHLIIEFLAGALAGATLSPRVRSQKKNPDQPMKCSQLFVGFDPVAFDSMNFDVATEELRAAVRSSYESEPEGQFFPDQRNERLIRSSDCETIALTPEVAHLFGENTRSP